MKKILNWLIAGGMVMAALLGSVGMAQAAPQSAPEAAIVQAESGEDDDEEPGYMQEMRQLMNTVIAEKLGIAPEDLQQRLKDGDKLAEIAEDEGISQEELHELLWEAGFEYIAGRLSRIC